MESYEKKGEEASSQADRLEEESRRVDERISQAKSEVQGNQNLPGVTLDEDEDAGDPAEAADEGEEPNVTSAD
jgi:hypothetical protein